MGEFSIEEESCSLQPVSSSASLIKCKWRRQHSSEEAGQAVGAALHDVLRDARTVEQGSRAMARAPTPRKTSNRSMESQCM